MRMNETEERVSEIEDKMMENNAAERKRERTYWIMKEDLENSVIP